MSDQKRCDFCDMRLTGDYIQHELVMDKEPKDVCEICWTSPIILSEMRRTRTRRPKRGRPRKDKITVNTYPQGTGSVSTDEGFLDALKPGA